MKIFETASKFKNTTVCNSDIRLCRYDSQICYVIDRTNRIIPYHIIIYIMSFHIPYMILNDMSYIISYRNIYYVISYHKTWQRFSTNYMVFLRPLVHIQPKLQLKFSFWVSVIYTMHILIDKGYNLFKNILKVKH